MRGPHASVGMIFQEESTFPWRTVLDNVAFPLEIAGMAKAERMDRARHFIELVGLESVGLHDLCAQNGSILQGKDLALDLDGYVALVGHFHGTLR